MVVAHIPEPSRRAVADSFLTSLEAAPALVGTRGGDIFFFVLLPFIAEQHNKGENDIWDRE